MRSRSTWASWIPSCACLLLGCAEELPSGSVDPSVHAGSQAPALPFDAGEQPAFLDSGAAQPPARPQPTAAPLPDEFIETELGGYALGPALAAGSTELPSSEPGRCTWMTAVVRDFRGARETEPHPDFEVFDGKKPTVGLVGALLGTDQKPKYASRCEASFDRAACPYGQMTTAEAAFTQWYRAVPGVNQTFALYLVFVANGGVHTFQSKSFFPVDGAGFGNAGGKRKHNFGFTTELHGRFRYRGGETFSFTGDDDLWVFINGRLALDLGGLHPPATASIALDTLRDELGIEPGNDYALDLFHAERHSAASNFRVDTTIEFSDCGQVIGELL